MQYHHAGYERAKNLFTIDRNVSADSRESQWVTEVMEVIDEVSHML